MSRSRDRPVIAVGSGDPVWRGRGLWLDGAHPVVHDVALSFDDDPHPTRGSAAGALLIRPSGSDPVRWAYDEIRTVPGQARTEGAVLGLAQGDAPARLIVGTDDIGLIRTRARRLHRAPQQRGSWKRVLLGVVALAAVALTIALLALASGATLPTSIARVPCDWAKLRAICG